MRPVSLMPHLERVLSSLRTQHHRWEPPIAGTFATGPNAAFKVLISTVLSLRTKDTTTGPASRRLFERAQTPRQMLELSARQIEKIVYPVGFYRTKARSILEICRILIERYDGRVPDDMDRLLELPGVGRKTANLVLTVGFGKPGICVDTHVHRISNRWGIVRTRTPEETEMALRRRLPRQHWIGYNDLLVVYGQNVCLPISPKCNSCIINKLCPKRGVKTHR
ncbi:MAG: Endonuclease III [Candidatus Omnitrophica bacterium]|nr:Endonuclease III [Candidatus Omnitrophota bacterium]